LLNSLPDFYFNNINPLGCAEAFQETMPLTIVFVKSVINRPLAL